MVREQDHNNKKNYKNANNGNKQNTKKNSKISTKKNHTGAELAVTSICRQKKTCKKSEKVSIF